MHFRRNAFLFTFLLAVVPSLSLAEEMFYTAPSRLAHTHRQMNTAGFWIGRHPAPDQVIMTPQGIIAFNNHVRDDLKLTKDIFAAPAGARYGLTVHYTDVRFAPTDEPRYETPGDVDFDQQQNSTLDVGTPVVVTQESADKKWFYVLSATSDGWVRSADVALGDEKAVRDFASAKKFAVAVKAKADIFLDDGMARFDDYVRMGTRLPLIKTSGGKTQVRVPVAGKDGALEIATGYMNSNDVHEGYLPYTARAVYTQAFAMLNQPYGWGGMYGEQDCSAFLDEVFATVGIILPRDSKDQAQVGRKLAALKDAPPLALLPLKGHIMLYLGSIEGRPYAIHAVWAYRERGADKDIPRVINRVVVSDLSLGEGSHKGSLLERLTGIVEVK